MDLQAGTDRLLDDVWLDRPHLPQRIWHGRPLGHRGCISRRAPGLPGNGAHIQIAKSLNSSGSVFKIEDAIGKEAVVYQRISIGGVGKISICMNDFTREIDAIEHKQEAVESFTRVYVLKKADPNTVVVKKI